MKPTITKSLLRNEKQPFSHVNLLTMEDIIESELFGELAEKLFDDSFISTTNIDLLARAATELKDGLTDDPAVNKRITRTIANRYCRQYCIKVTPSQFATAILTVCIISIIYNVVEDARYRAFMLAECLTLNGYGLAESLQFLELDPKCVRNSGDTKVVELEGVHILINDDVKVVYDKIDYTYLNKIKKVLV